MKYVFDPDVLREVAHSHLDLPLEEMLPAIARDLAERYPGRIDTSPEWRHYLCYRLQYTRELRVM